MKEEANGRQADKQTSRQAAKQTSSQGSELHFGSVFVFVVFVVFVVSSLSSPSSLSSLSSLWSLWSLAQADKQISRREPQNFCLSFCRFVRSSVRPSVCPFVRFVRLSLIIIRASLRSPWYLKLQTKKSTRRSECFEYGIILSYYSMYVTLIAVIYARCALSDDLGVLNVTSVASPVQLPLA